MAETYIEAAFAGSDGSKESYFFLGDHYVIYNWDKDRAQDGVRPVSEWGIPLTFTPPPLADGSPELAGLDGAIRGRAGFSSFAYAFKDTGYLRLKLAPRGLDGTGALSIWGLPGSAFAAADRSK